MAFDGDGLLLVLEPYYGGSHRNFLDNLTARLGLPFRLLTLPARKWKWRMRLSAPYFVSHLSDQLDPGLIKAILCSTFVDVALLKSLLPPELNRIPILVYFHENQFAYPVQVEAERDLHFALSNFTTALAADRIAFNSAYNRDTFLAGAADMLKKAPDMPFPPEFIDEVREKSRVIFPGLDFSLIDQLPDNHKAADDGPPVIVWNHRWEHDKGPEVFFDALMTLDRMGKDFGLIVLGQSFSRCPEIFAQAEEALAGHIIHFGYVEERRTYLKLLSRADLVVSTAEHEFYGMAVIEAVRCGVRPFLPDDLAYPEFFGSEFLYQRDRLIPALIDALGKKRLGHEAGRRMTERFSWQALLPEFSRWLENE